MNTTAKLSITIHFTDGITERFEAPHVAKDPLLSGNIGILMEKRLGQQYLILELEDRLRIIPTHSIRHMEITPVPSKLPDVVIRGVRRIE